MFPANPEGGDGIPQILADLIYENSKRHFSANIWDLATPPPKKKRNCGRKSKKKEEK